MAIWLCSKTLPLKKNTHTQETRNATNCVTQGVFYFLFLEIIDGWTKLFGNKSCFAHLLALRWVTVIGSSLLGKFAYTKSQAKVRQENPFLCQVEWQQTHRWETQQPVAWHFEDLLSFFSLPVRASNIAAGKCGDGVTFKDACPQCVCWTGMTEKHHSDDAHPGFLRKCAGLWWTEGRMLREKGTWWDPCDGCWLFWNSRRKRSWFNKSKWELVIQIPCTQYSHL